jgi:transcription termination factor Rho
MSADTVKGLVERDHRGSAYLRQLTLEMETRPDDPSIPPHLLRQYNLTDSCLVEGTAVHGQRGRKELKSVTSVNNLPPADWIKREPLARRTAIDPFERLQLTLAPNDYSMRVVDLLCPIGKGQRALIVAPPRSGKTVLMQQLAKSVSTNHPEVHLMVLLVDERPEEVTDMRRTIRGEVFASSSDSDRDQHVRLAQMVLEYAKRLVEAGRDVVLLLDSLTKMGRAFNAVQKSSGRIMSGGVDIRALEIPKRIFGAARTLEGGGSLTIIATALVDTNSRMDELIFQEFKGTGNMELVLNRDLSNERIYPAINIPESGTRREELLFGRETTRYQELRRYLHNMKPKEAMLTLLKALEQYPTNRKLLSKVSREPEEV